MVRRSSHTTRITMPAIAAADVGPYVSTRVLGQVRAVTLLCEALFHE
jgi:hypothetical protein